jgi:hypothetical protein
MTQPDEKLMRECWVRVMRDSRTKDGSGGMLPSEAASFVGEMLGVPAIEVLLAAGSRTNDH